MLCSTASFAACSSDRSATQGDACTEGLKNGKPQGGQRGMLPGPV